MAVPRPAPASGAASAAEAALDARGAGERGSYIYVSHATGTGSDDASFSSAEAEGEGGGAAQPRRYEERTPRPRCFILLPLLAAADLGSSGALAWLVLWPLHSASSPGDGTGDGEGEGQATREKTLRLLLLVVAVGAARALVFAALGVSRQVRERAIGVAGMCLLLFVLLEWAAYISVVGVRLPPGRVGALRARRWQRGVREEHWRGEEGSLYDAGDEAADAQELEQEANSEDEEEAQASDIRPHSLRRAQAQPHDSAPESDAEDDVAGGAGGERSPLLRTPTLPRSTTLPNVSEPPHSGLGSAARLRTRASYGALGSAGANRRSMQQSPRVSLYGGGGGEDVEAQRRFPASGDSADELDADDLVDAPLDRVTAREHSRRRLESAKLRGDAERERRTSLIGPLAFVSSPGGSGAAQPRSPIASAAATSPRLAPAQAPSTPAPPRRSSSALGAPASASPMPPASPAAASPATASGRKKLKLRLWPKKQRGGAGREATESPSPGPPSPSSRGGSAPPPTR